MTEKLLQFIWKFQYFNHNELRTQEEELLFIIDPGKLNTDQGPDFYAAKIRVGNTILAGNIEIHILATDWYTHHHYADGNYRNVILHVVWKYNLPEKRDARQGFPTLELQHRVPGILLERYEQLMNSPCFVPCEKIISRVKDLIWVNWKERLLVERLQRKSGYILELLKQSNYYWEETFWWMIARNFGMLVNADAFEAIARTIPVNILKRHKNQIHQVESLLFGQAGLLNSRFAEDYPLILQKEYRFYRKKYRLHQAVVPLKFLRMRPSSFPSVRLAQLAMLIHSSDHLLSAVREKDALPEVRALLNVSANDYWHYHYRFGESSRFNIKNTGTEMINNILINTIIPVLFAYGSYHKEQVYINKAICWMQEVTSEKNRVTHGWTSIGVKSKNAADSQALLELKTYYCNDKRCLDCNIGNALLKRDQD